MRLVLIICGLWFGFTQIAFATEGKTVEIIASQAAKQAAGGVVKKSVPAIGAPVNIEMLNANIVILKARIDKINNDLNTKQSKINQLDVALKDSDAAIVKYNEILSQLQRQTDLEAAKLNDIESSLTPLALSLESSATSVSFAINKTYQEINTLSNKNDSILNGNDKMNQERQKVYLISILNMEVSKYRDLQGKLGELNNYTLKLQKEITRLIKKMQSTTLKQKSKQDE